MQEKKGIVNGKTTQKQSVTRENAEEGEKSPAWRKEKQDERVREHERGHC